MIYRILLWPHANARYQAESVKLGRAELELTLRRVCPDAMLTDQTESALPLLEFSAPEALTTEALRALSDFSLLYALFECADGWMRPVVSRAEAYLGHDLPSILKYKGKTNEQFTALTQNVALHSARFRLKPGERLRFLDPMCSRGTSLFLAVNRGWDADGGDISAPDIRELNQFFKRYLEYHRFKHKIESKSFTVKGAKPVAATICQFANDPEAFRMGETVTLRTAEGDCGKIAHCLNKSGYHIICCDLPYGIQHSAGKETFEQLLRRVLPAWKNALVPGGSPALSFNINTLPAAKVRALMEQSGFEAQQGVAYDRFPHWVEQAVTRDIAVGVRPE